MFVPLQTNTPTRDEVDVLPADAVVVHLSQHQGHALLALAHLGAGEQQR